MTRCERLDRRHEKMFDLGLRGGRDARHAGAAAMKLLAVLLRAMLAAGAATTVVAYLLLTNSHL